MARAAHALVVDGQVWLIDPFEDAEALSAAAQLGATAGILQLLDRHNRDCAALAQRLGVPLLRLPTEEAQMPFTPVPVISTPVWREVALWWAQERALIVAEAIGTAPLFALRRRAGVHPLLRLIPPRGQLSRFEPERLLVGHGPPLQSAGGEALQEALATSRSDAPRLALSIPGLLRGGGGRGKN